MAKHIDRWLKHLESLPRWSFRGHGPAFGGAKGADLSGLGAGQLGLMG